MDTTQARRRRENGAQFSLFIPNYSLGRFCSSIFLISSSFLFVSNGFFLFFLLCPSIFPLPFPIVASSFRLLLSPSDCCCSSLSDLFHPSFFSPFIHIPFSIPMNAFLLFPLPSVLSYPPLPLRAPPGHPLLSASQILDQQSRTVLNLVQQTQSNRLFLPVTFPRSPRHNSDALKKKSTLFSPDGNRTDIFPNY